MDLSAAGFLNKRGKPFTLCPMKVELITWREEFADAFARLNYQWIETFFAIEAEDRRALDNPQAYALDKGGEIFFVLEDECAVGTVAMVPVNATNNDYLHVFELAKMAVHPECQGRGYSRLLMDACVQFAQERQADEIMLVTNDILGPALGLYLSAGFVAKPQMHDQRYARGNLEMSLVLKKRVLQERNGG